MDVIDELDITELLLAALSLSFDHTWQDVGKRLGYMNLVCNVCDFYFECNVECLARYGKAFTPPGMMYIDEEYPNVYFIVYNDKLLSLEDNRCLIKNIGNDHFVLENEHGEHFYNIEIKEKYVRPDTVVISITAAGIELENGISISKTRRMEYYWPGDPTDMSLKSTSDISKKNGRRKLYLDYGFQDQCESYDQNIKLIERQPRSLTKPIFFIKTNEEMLARYDEIMAYFR